jgi:PKD repeat protein
LTITDNSGAQNSSSVSITVSAATLPLVASALGSPTSGAAPLAVSFTGSASGGVSPYSFSWSFGDGQTSTLQSPAHNYANTGSYTATLTVTDNSGAQNSSSVSITVSAAALPLLASASGAPISGTAPLAVSFTGSASGGVSPYSFSWSFGDGQSSALQSPPHSYANPGTYIAILTITDGAGNAASKSLKITALTERAVERALKRIASRKSNRGKSEIR